MRTITKRQSKILIGAIIGGAVCACLALSSTSQKNVLAEQPSLGTSRTGVFVGDVVAKGTLITLSATLDAQQAVPPTISAATGTAKMVINRETKSLNIQMTLEGLIKAKVTAIHLHLGKPGETGPILVDFNLARLSIPRTRSELERRNDPGPSTRIGTRTRRLRDHKPQHGLHHNNKPTTLTLSARNVPFPAQHLTALFASDVYLNIHTKKFPDGVIRGQMEQFPGAPGPLSEIEVPLPPDLSDFIKDMDAAIALGKSFFWDVQVGSDGKTACATCHAHAFADARTRNTLAPAQNRVDFPRFRGGNVDLQTSTFPFHRLIDPLNRDSGTVFDTTETVGSQGVVQRDFAGIQDGSAVDLFTEPEEQGIFTVGGIGVRQSTSRQAPINVNAIFQDRNFWDGRANRFFNGVDPFGDQNPDATVYRAATTTEAPLPTQILLDNGALASQAVAPPLSSIEMSWKGRTFPDVGRKMLQLRPLAKQEVHLNDSVLGPHATMAPQAKGLNTTYVAMIQKAFADVWWQGAGTVTIDGKQFTHMEANFSLYWGLAVMAYHTQLVSDETPFDRFAAGDPDALTHQQKEGLRIFLNEGRCISCHESSVFTKAAVSFLRGDPDEIEILDGMDDSEGADRDKFYDNGFNNTAVRRTNEDNAQGGGFGNPFQFFALTNRSIAQDELGIYGLGLMLAPGTPEMTGGNFKVPTLRNVELTGPFMHNGGMTTLEEVMIFYVRGGNFFQENIEDVDNDVRGIPEIVNAPDPSDKVAALVELMKAFTDERVRFQKAPFDHPELVIPNGHSGFVYGVALDNNVVVPAVGAGGSPTAVKPFDQILLEGGLK